MPTDPGPRRGRPRDPRIDEAILRAVRELLATGTGRVTHDEVARRAGVSRPTVYLRFPRTADLVFEAGLEAATPPPEFLEPGNPAVPDTGSLEGDLAAVAEVAAASFAGLDDVGLLRGFIAALAGDPQLAERLWLESVEPSQRVLRAVIDRWRDRGEIPEGRDTELALEVFPALDLYRRVLLDRPMGDEERRLIVRLVADGLRGVEPGSAGG